VNRCTLQPALFRFHFRSDILRGRWASTEEIRDCCCLEDGLRHLVSRGFPLDLLTTAEFERPSGEGEWYVFSTRELREIEAIVLGEDK